MTLYVDPQVVFDNVASLRTTFAPSTTGQITAPTLENGQSSYRLSHLATLTAELPAAIAAQLEVLAQSFVDAVADALEAD